MAQWDARRLFRGAHQPRQFEFHPEDDALVVFGTVDGKAVVGDIHADRILHSFQITEEPRDVILGLCWLRSRPRTFVAGSGNGCLALQAAPEEGASSAELPAVRYEAFEKLTSVCLNSTETLILASGYTHNARLYDLETQKVVRDYSGIHDGHINISRFANMSPFVMATSSFDRTVKVWDIRTRADRPLYTCRSRNGNVMCTFSPNDAYLLTAAVDNEITQYLAVDGRENLKLAVPRTGMNENFTRAYYLNSGNAICSGSSEERCVRIFSSHSGECLDTIEMYPNARHESLYIQSLRGSPHRDDALAVLVNYRSCGLPLELVLVEARQSPEPPRSPPADRLQQTGQEALDPLGEGHDAAASPRCACAHPTERLACDLLHLLYTANDADVRVECGGNAYLAHAAVLFARCPALLPEGFAPPAFGHREGDPAPLVVDPRAIGGAGAVHTTGALPLLLEFVYSDALSPYAFARVLSCIEMHDDGEREHSAGRFVRPRRSAAATPLAPWPPAAAVPAFGLRAEAGEAAGEVASWGDCGDCGRTICRALEVCVRAARGLRLARLVGLLELLGRAAAAPETALALLDVALREQLPQLLTYAADFVVRHWPLVQAAARDLLEIEVQLEPDAHPGGRRKPLRSFFQDGRGAPPGDAMLLVAAANARVDASAPATAEDLGAGSDAPRAFQSLFSQLPGSADSSADEVARAAGRFGALPFADRVASLMVLADAECSARRAAAGGAADEVARGERRAHVPSCVGHTAAIGLGNLMYVLGGANATTFSGCRHLMALDVSKRRWLRLRARGDGPAALIGHASCPLDAPPLLRRDVLRFVARDGAWTEGSAFADRGSRYLLLSGGHLRQLSPFDEPSRGPFAANDDRCSVWILDTLRCEWHNATHTAGGNVPGQRTRHSMVWVPARGALVAPPGPMLRRTSSGDGVNGTARARPAPASTAAAATAATAPPGAPAALSLKRDADGRLRIRGSGGRFAWDVNEGSTCIIFGGRTSNYRNGSFPSFLNDIALLHCRRRADADEPADKSAGGSAAATAAHPRAHPHALASSRAPFDVVWITPTVLGTPPRPRLAHATCLCDVEGLGRCMVVIGGCSETALENDVHVLRVDELDSLQWVPVRCAGADLPARHSHSLTHIGGGKLLMFGGIDRTKEVFREAFEVALASFSAGGVSGVEARVRRIYLACEGLGAEASGSIEPRSRHSAVAFGDEVLIFGGTTNLQGTADRPFPPCRETSSEAWSLQTSDRVVRSAEAVFLDAGKEPAVCPPGSTLHADLGRLLHSSGIGDVTFAFGDGESDGAARVPAIAGARCLLKKRSRTFDAMLRNGSMREAVEGIVRLPDCRAEIFASVLRFMYTGTVDVPAEHATELLFYAARFGVDGLVQLLEGELLSFTTWENAGSLLQIADMLGLAKLRAVAVAYALRDHERVTGAESWAALPEELRREVEVFRTSKRHMYCCNFGDHEQANDIGAWRTGDAGIEHVERARPELWEFGASKQVAPNA